MTSRLVRAGLVLAALALVLPLAAGAGIGKSKRADAGQRILFATDSAGNLCVSGPTPPRLRGLARSPGSPPGVVLKGIDFRPATGDLYAPGSDKVVWVNPWTAIAVAEGPGLRVHGRCPRRQA
jgi:hypothetical protein